MEKATISELKNRLSAYLKKVRAGRTILVMDRDEPIARLERIPPGQASDDRVGRLERAGLVRRAARKLDPAELRREGPKARRSVVEALVEDRRDGR